MTRKKCFIFILVFILAGSKPLWATKEGTGNPWAFMTIGSGARAMGLGGAFVAIADDATATYWNPAGLGFLESHEATFMSIQLTDKLAGEYHYGSLAFKPFRLGSIGASVHYFNIGDIHYTAGTSELDFQRLSIEEDTEWAGSLSYAYPFSFGNLNNEKWFALGTSIRYLSQDLTGLSSNALNVDMGFLARIDQWWLFNRVRSGYVLQFYSDRTFGDPPPLDSDDFELEKPETEKGFTSWRWGLALDWELPGLPDAFNNVTTAIALVNRREGSPLFLSAGAEFSTDDKIFALRLGVDDLRVYKRDALTASKPRLTGGFGIGYRYVQLDYAVSFDSLETQHRFSITGRLPE
jgi:hypothetical protein